MKLLTISALAVLTSGVFANSNAYNEALETLNNAPADIKAVMDQAPKAYTFNSQFDGVSDSVSYPGQTFRQVLINDLYIVMATAKRQTYLGKSSDALAWLTSYYNYSEDRTITSPNMIDGNSLFAITAVTTANQTMEIDEGFFYNDIQSPGKNLQSKIAGNDNPLRRGKLFGLTNGAETPTKQVEAWLNEFSKAVTTEGTFTVPNGALKPQVVAKAGTMPDGRDLAQLTQKFLHGAVSYSQAARDYFSIDLGDSKGLNVDNSVPAKQGKPYTAMEHHFDEAFGYFGASRDYLSYTDIESRSKRSIDTDGNGFISLKAEKNMGISTNVSRFDMTAAAGNLDMSKDVMQAFLKGRHLVTQKPADYKKYVVAQARVALGTWEKTLAAVTIHYINSSVSMAQAYGTNQYLFSNFAKFWSEMKGFAFAFQFNPNAMMTDADFDQMHALMKDSPVVPHAEPAAVKAYMADLISARNILQATYGFNSTNVEQW